MNMRELADALSITRQTLSLWLVRSPDFPVEVRGTKGTEYQFDLVKVREFLRSQAEARAVHSSERDQALAQMALPLNDAAPRSTIRDQIEAMKLRRMMADEAERSGRLIETAGVVEMLEGIVRDLECRLHKMASDGCLELRLPAAFMQSLDADLAEAHGAFVRDLVSSLRKLGYAGPVRGPLA
jgi:phage terminase Nu1 subunit (DNA packaging protein)